MEDIQKHHEDFPGVCKKENEAVDRIKTVIWEKIINPFQTHITATSFFLPHQNLAKSHHLSSGAKDSKPLKYKNTDIREQNIYNYD